jgi:hypothetical protein
VKAISRQSGTVCHTLEIERRVVPAGGNAPAGYGADTFPDFATAVAALDGGSYKVPESLRKLAVYDIANTTDTEGELKKAFFRFSGRGGFPQTFSGLTMNGFQAVQMEW